MIEIRMGLVAAIFACSCAVGCEQREPDIFSEPERAAAVEARPGSHDDVAPVAAAEAPTPGSVVAPSANEDRPSARGEHANADSNSPTSPTGRAPADWTVPTHWQEYEPASEMRLANWRLPAVGDDTGQGECAVFQFAGGGDAEANIRRWLTQFKNEQGEPAQENAQRAELIVDSVPTFLVRTSGTYETQMPPMTGETVRLENYGLFGVVFATETPVFIKCTGPEAVISGEAEAITAFVRSFQFPR